MSPDAVAILAAMAWGAVVGLAMAGTGFVPLIILSPVGGWLISAYLPKLLAERTGM